jgi:GNAT superfamily N-acetyltransferase
MINIEVISSERFSIALASEVHELHARNLYNDVLPSFGRSVEQRYLRHLCSNDNGIIVIAVDDSKLVGFIALRFKPINMSTFVSMYDAFRFIFRSLARPRVMVSFIVQLLKTQRNPAGSYEIDYFVVDEACRSKGIGTKMLHACDQIANINGVNLIYTKTSNMKLYKFYRETKGAILINSFSTPFGTYKSIAWYVTENVLGKS